MHAKNSSCLLLAMNDRNYPINYNAFINRITTTKTNVSFECSFHYKFIHFNASKLNVRYFSFLFSLVFLLLGSGSVLNSALALVQDSSISGNFYIVYHCVSRQNISLHAYTFCDCHTNLSYSLTTDIN